MKTFKYTVVKQSGKTKAGTLHAESVEEAMDRLSKYKEIMMLTDMGEYEIKYIAFAIEKISANKLRRVSEKELPGFMDRLASMMAAKINASVALTKLGAYGDKNTRAIPNRLLQHINAGYSLDQAFGREKEYFRRDYGPLIKAGIHSDTLAPTLKRIADDLRNAERLKAQVKSALSYPKMLFSFAAVACVVLFKFLLPTLFGMLAELFDGELPPLTEAIVGIMEFFERWGLIILVTGIVFYVAGRILVKKFFMLQWDAFLLKLPLIGKVLINRDIITLFRGLGNLTGAGLSDGKSLEISISGIQNRFIRYELKKCRNKLERDGVPLAVALQGCQYVRPLDLQIIMIGATSSSLPEMLRQRADDLTEDNEISMKNITSKIGPIVTVMVSSVIIIIVISVYLPIFSIMGSQIK